jgi:hypothetical protein
MKRAVVNSLTEAQRLLIAETEPAALRDLDEDALVALHDRVRRARNKYTGIYRREASGRVREKGGRGKARPVNARNRDRAEVFEDALARVSRSLATAAKASAAELRDARIAAARAGGSAPAGKGAETKATAPKKAASTAKSTSRNPRRGDRSLVSPKSKRAHGSTTAATARKQARKDSR